MSKVCHFGLPVFLVTALLSLGTLAAAQRETSIKSMESSDILRGQKIYEKNCAICHFSTTTEKKIGPGLKGVMNQKELSGDRKSRQKSLVQWIENGGKDMPPSHLNREQIRELIAYLKTL